MMNMTMLNKVSPHLVHPFIPIFIISADKADCLTDLGLLNEALSLYMSCAQILTPDRLHHFTSSLSTRLLETKSRILSGAKGASHSAAAAAATSASPAFILSHVDKADPWSCTECFGVLCEAVSLPCGHSYCRDCLRQPWCKKCGAKFKPTVASADRRSVTSGVLPNVMVNKLCAKYWSLDIKAAELRIKGSEMFRKQNISEALSLFTKAVELGKFEYSNVS